MSAKKDSVINHITRSVKNLLVSGIKDIYHQAKNSAETNHDVKMDVNNLMKTSVLEALRENNKCNDDIKLNEEELKNLILSAKDQVMNALKDDKSATQIRNELMGFDDLDEFDDILDGLESNIFKLDEAFEDDKNITIDKTEMTMYVIGFLNTQVDLDWFNNFARDHYNEIKNLILSKFNYKLATTVNYDSSEVDNLNETLLHLDNSPKVIDSKSGKLITGTMEKGIGESTNFNKNSEDRCEFISKANTIENILNSIDESILDEEKLAKLHAFSNCIDDIIKYYNNINNDNVEYVDLFKSVKLVGLLSSVYDISKSINLYTLFYLNLVDESKLDILKNNLFNICIKR